MNSWAHARPACQHKLQQLGSIIIHLQMYGYVCMGMRACIGVFTNVSFCVIFLVYWANSITNKARNDYHKSEKTTTTSVRNA